MKSPKFLHVQVQPFRTSKQYCCNQVDEFGQTEVLMAKVKKMIKSPINKRKQEGNINNMKTFGVSLEELLKRNSEGGEIPTVLEKITEFIKRHGLRHEGIFRVNGNKKVMEKLKSEFDRDGDADLEECGDVMSVAGLMKMFLRELPEPLIPKHFKTAFIQVHKDYHEDRKECCLRMRKLAEDLPKLNRELLKFLCRFLVQISLNKDANKMNPNSLAIVFAPNIFRCVDGIEGVKEQSATNSIVGMLIMEYDSIFKGENEESPFLMNCIRVQEAKENTFSAASAVPIPFGQHKKLKQRKEKLYSSEQFDLISPYAEFRVTDHDRLVINEEPKPKHDHIYASVNKTQKESVLGSAMGYHSPDEAEPYIRSNSPSWHKPNEEPTSPKPGSSPKSRKEYMERTIKESINELLFGHNLTSTSEESDKWDSPGEEAPPVPPRSANIQLLDESGVRLQKRKKRRGSKSSQDSRQSDEEAVDEVDALFVDQELGIETRQNHKTEHELDPASVRSAKRAHRLKPVDMENGQQLIVSVVDYGSPDKSFMKNEEMLTNSTEELNNSSNVDLSNIRRSSEVLSCLTLNRAPPPRKRRPPSLHKSAPGKIDFRNADGEVKGDVKSLPRKPPSPPPRSVLSPGNSLPPSVASKIEGGSSGCAVATPNWLDILRRADKIEAKGLKNYRRKQVRSMPDFPKAVTEREYEIDSEGSSFASDDSAVTSIKPKKSENIPIIPPLELYKLGEWSEDDLMVSPRERYDGSGFDDAMISPRSRRATLDIRGVSTECPPSPPGMQEYRFWHDKKSNTSPKGDSTMKDLTKRMQTMKKKVKEFEEKFEDEYGYKPTQNQDRLPIKKYIAELARTRRLIQELKEKKTQGDRSSGENNPQAATSTRGSESLLTTVPGTVEHSLQKAINKLKDKRQSSGRPESVDALSRDQLQDEKLAVQKALIQHENTFGRPTSKRDKDVMKPLYDRYRTIKRRIANFSTEKDLSNSNKSSRSSQSKEDSRKQSPERPNELDLTPVLQDTLIDSSSDGNLRLTQSLPARTTKDKGRKLFDSDISPVSPLTIFVGDAEEERTLTLEDDTEYSSDGQALTRTTADHSLLSAKDPDAILHQASMTELLEQQASAIKRKKKLRKKLKTFEDNFVKKVGRKVQKEDRGPHEVDYEEYKKLKARLRLLDVLITKHQVNNTI